MYQNLNLNNLKYFHEVANLKNITKASSNLNITQPALTRAIKQLEIELNTNLLIRSKKGVTLTPEGEILYEYTKSIFQMIDNTINTIEINKEKGGHIYIGATTTNFLEIILPTLNKFRKKYPMVHIHMILEEINILENYNKLGKLDIFIKNDYETLNNMEIIKNFTISDRFIASKKHYHYLEDKVLSLEEVLSFPLVLLSNITHGRKNFDSFLSSKNISMKPTYEFNSYSLCKELIRNGFGIGIGNPIHYQTNDFLILKTNFNLPSRKFNICCNKNSKNILLKHFIDILKEKEEI